jgi:hypothetical protein
MPNGSGRYKANLYPGSHFFSLLNCRPRTDTKAVVFVSVAGAQDLTEQCAEGNIPCKEISTIEEEPVGCRAGPWAYRFA